LDSVRGRIQHVIYIQFDNTHLRRDNPNVPSDLEQMPHLLTFIQNNGTLDGNHHTVLISHIANGILTALTGVYSDRHGMPVANSYVAFRPNGTTVFPSSFFYWTDTVNDVVSTAGDPNFGMLAADGRNAPAPWVPFTRAGCDVGAFSTANIVIERTPFDVVKVFGAGSPEARETSAQQARDFEGIAVHCAQGSPLCTPANHAVDDLLPQEPGTYTGFKALFGDKYVGPALISGPLRDLDNNLITDPISGLTGFPTNFSPSATQTLGAIATMQEAGIPVTFSYIADAHDNRATGLAFGPGQAGYVAQLKAYDDAFDKFFKRLAQDHIDKSNTLFIFTADEGDHFAGGPPNPADCNGIIVPCSYSKIGEQDVNLNALVTLQTGNSTPFSIHFDMAPTISITGNPAQTSTTTRQLERDFSKLTGVNQVTNQTDKLAEALIDQTEMGLLHMLTADPARTPNFIMFAPADYFFLSSGSMTPSIAPGFAWNHGGIQNEIAQTWLGTVGPGVLKGDTRTDDGSGIVFSDHTDIRPTIMALLGLQDDYTHDGRVLFEVLNPSTIPHSLTVRYGTLLDLARIYKQINAPFGQLSLDSLPVSTRALASDSTNDAVYTTLENKIANWRTQRDAIAGSMKAMLEGAAFQGQAINEKQAKQLIAQGQALLNLVHACASDIASCEQ